ncbi:MAG: hypothetical protein KF740_00830 [Ramlibacter sp.]|nr:hypothetical protein [Ramlibacter sp.]
MQFSHAPDIWNLHGALVPGVLAVAGLHARAPVSDALAAFHATAAQRLAAAPESEWPEVQAWRRAYSRMGFKPTQYRCASESLLRRLRLDGHLPRIHPLIDLCNAASVAFAIPVAVFDLDFVQGDLQVILARGTESFETFSGDIERPEPGEVIFADAGGRAHARRWVHRQSGTSAVREGTRHALIVAEAQHAQAPEHVPRLVEALARALRAAWGSAPRTGVLSASAPRFDAGLTD